MSNSPYRGLPRKAFWKSAVSGRDVGALREIHEPKFALTREHKIATAGSCFAQHIARHLRRHGFSVLDLEPAPPRTSEAWREKHQFGIYSARYGNLYYVRQLLQLAEEAFGRRTPENWIWRRGDRYFDALRPSVEPLGHDSEEEVRRHREQHLAAVRRLLSVCDVFVFTFGLTEGWVDPISGTAFPTAPGTICGDYDTDRVEFRNFDYVEILEDFQSFVSLIRSVNPDVKFLLTVSPVALAATASGEHVLTANTYSKSVLRAVAGRLADTDPGITYFPSYELITGPLLGDLRYNADQRTVRSEAVEAVMRQFLLANGVDVDAVEPTPPPREPTLEEKQERREAELCEDAMLEVFAR